MTRTLVSGAGKSVCSKCSRAVQFVKVGGVSIAVDPEILTYVPSGPYGEVIPASAPATGRRVHAEMCERYRLEADKELRRKEMAEYNRKNRGL